MMKPEDHHHHQQERSKEEATRLIYWELSTSRVPACVIKNDPVHHHHRHLHQIQGRRANKEVFVQQIPFAKKGMYSRPLFTNANEKGWKIKQAGCPINRYVEVVSSFSLPLRRGWRWLARRAHHAVGRVDDVQESIFVLVLLVDLREECARLGQRVAVHEEEDGLVGPELDVLPNLRDQLCDGNIARSQEPATKFVSIFWPERVAPSNECGSRRRTYFLLEMSGMSLLLACFSTITGTRSGWAALIFAARRVLFSVFEGESLTPMF